jgi:hypothetical protein
MKHLRGSSKFVGCASPTFGRRLSCRMKVGTAHLFGPSATTPTSLPMRRRFIRCAGGLFRAPMIHSMRRSVIRCAGDLIRAPQVHPLRRRFIPCAGGSFRAPERHSLRRRASDFVYSHGTDDFAL